MKLKTRTHYLIIAVILFVLVIGVLVFLDRTSSLNAVDTNFLDSDSSVESDYVVPPMEVDYQNEQFRFSLMLPEGFTAAQLPYDGKGTPVVLQDALGNGIQIYVTENVGNTKVLRAHDIIKQIPDMKVTNVQEVEIGNNHSGVAFKSDNEAYGGASREVWFIFNGDLYQISTYERLDNLLKNMFVTWKFY